MMRPTTSTASSSHHSRSGSASASASVRSYATRSRAGTAVTATATAGKQAAFLSHNHIKMIKGGRRPVTAAGGVAMPMAVPSSSSLSTSSTMTMASSWGRRRRSSSMLGGGGGGMLGVRGGTITTPASGSASVSVSASTARQVQDASYYISLLKSNEIAIEQEMTVMEEEMTQWKTMQHASQMRQETYQTISHEISSLEQTMTDYNHAMDQISHGTDPDDVEVKVLDVRQKRDDLTTEVDELFLANRSVQKAIEKVEDDISDLYDTIERILQQSRSSGSGSSGGGGDDDGDDDDDDGEDPVREYHRLTEELKQLKIQRGRMEEELTSLHMKLKECQTIASQRPDKTLMEQCDVERRRVKELTASVKATRDELNIARMGTEEAKSYLLERVKGDKKEVSELEDQCRVMDDEFYRLSRVERDVLEEMEQRKKKEATMHGKGKGMGMGKDDDANLYERMYWRREKAMEYLSSSDGVVSGLHHQIETKQKRIVALLKDLSQGLDATRAPMPSHDTYRALNEDVNFKAKHLANSELTMARLLQQKERRIVELKKINELEHKIHQEEEQLKARIQQMKKDMEVYEDLDELGDMEEMAKEYLTLMKERYTTRSHILQSSIRDELSVQYDDIQSELDGSETYQSLLHYEEKIRRQGQVIFSLKDYIQRKGKETEYETIRMDCMGMLANSNSSGFTAMTSSSPQ